MKTDICWRAEGVQKSSWYREKQGRKYDSDNETIYIKENCFTKIRKWRGCGETGEQKSGANIRENETNFFPSQIWTDKTVKLIVSLPDWDQRPTLFALLNIAG